VNGICGCGLPARCCQPAVAGGVIYAALWGELSTHLAPQALFTQSSPVHKPLLQAFPFPSTLGEVTLHPLSQACMFVYSSHGNWVFPALLWSFPHTVYGTSCDSSQAVVIHGLKQMDVSSRALLSLDKKKTCLMPSCNMI
jgi:hypothetical protein